jgi:ABC-type dipeptide/oligopeptide/nickel transport system ATPase component
MDALLACSFSTSYRSTGEGVRSIEFEIGHGEIFGVAGESGSGKSTIALSVSALAARRGGHTQGVVRFLGRNLLDMSERELRRIRGREIGWVSQSSGAALNPALRIGTHFKEVWRAHRGDGSWEDAAAPLLKTLRLPAPDRLFSLYPRELSVGMAQRVVIALGLLHQPKLLIADEPTSALDLATQRELLGLLRRFRDETGLSVLFISHDLLALMAVCDRIGVLRSGELVETLPAAEFLDGARHPYTRELAESLRALLPVAVETRSTGTCA